MPPSSADSACYLLPTKQPRRTAAPSPELLDIILSREGSAPALVPGDPPTWQPS